MASDESLYLLRPLSFDEARSVMAGIVPPEIREDCRKMVEWALETPSGVDYEGLNRGYQRRVRDGARGRETTSVRTSKGHKRGKKKTGEPVASTRAASSS